MTGFASEVSQSRQCFSSGLGCYCDKAGSERMQNETPSICFWRHCWKRCVARVRGCRVDHKKSIPPGWATQGIQKVCRGGRRRTEPCGSGSGVECSTADSRH